MLFIKNLKNGVKKDYGSGGWGFDSLWVHHINNGLR